MSTDRMRLLGICATALLVLSATALGQNRTWSGATNDNWNVAGNWLGANIADAGAETAVWDAADAGNQTDVDASITVGGLRFLDGCGAFTVADAAGDLTINGTANSIVTEEADDEVTISETIAIGAATVEFNIGAGGMAISSVISGNALNKTGAGTLDLSGVNTYSGTTTVAAGILDLTGGSINASTTVNITGGELQLGAAGQLADTAVVTLSNVAAAVLDLNGNNETIGQLSGGGGTGGNVTLGAGTLTVADGNGNTYAGNISGTGGLTLTTGTLNMTGDSDYTGTTTINGGQITLGAAASLDSATLDINAGELQLGANNQLANTAVVDLANAAAAVLDMNGFSDTVGQLTGGGGTGGNVTLGAGTLTIADGNGNTYSGVISGTGGVTLTTGAQTFANDNTYTGTTTINGGQLTLGAAASLASTTLDINAGELELGGNNQLADTAVVDLANNANAVLDMDGNSDTIGQLTGGGALGGNVTMGAGSLTIADGSGNTYAGVISGTGAVTLTTGTLTLTGTNTFSGGLVLDNGATVVAAADLNLGAAAGAISMDGAAIQFDGSFTDSTRAITVNAVAGGGTDAEFDTDGNNVTLQGVLADGAAAGSVTKSGTGMLTLTGANTFSGGLNIEGGVLQVGTDTSLGVVGGAVNFDNDAELQFSGGFTDTNRPIALNTDGAGSDGGTFDTNSNNVTLQGVIGDGGGAGNLTKVGVGTLTVANNATYTGTTTVGGGILNVGAAGSLNTTSAINITGGELQTNNDNQLADAAVVTMSNAAGALLDLNGNSDTIGQLAGGGALGGDVTMGAGTLTIADGAGNTYAGVISGTGAVVVTTGRQTLTGTNTFSGGITGNAGAVLVAGADLNLGAAGGAVALNGAELEYSAGFSDSTRAVTLGAAGGTVDTAGNNSTLNGVIGGAGALTKIGAGTLTLAGTNTFTGGLNIEGGTLQVGADLNLGPAGNAIAFDNDAELQISASFVDSTRGITLNTDGAGADGGTVDTNGSNLTLAGVIADGGAAGSLTKIGAGTLTLTGVNTFSGGLNLNVGTVSVGADSALGTGPLNFGGGTLAFTGSFVMDAPINVIAGDATLDTGANTITATGLITGTNDLIKNGAGTLIYTGDSLATFTGDVRHNVGTFHLGNVVGDRTVGRVGGDFINNADAVGTALLMGWGTIGGNLTNNAGGVINPGNSPGILNVGGNYVENGTLIIEIEPGTAKGTFPETPGTHYDQVNVAGTATLGAASLIDVQIDNKGYIANGDQFDAVTTFGGVTDNGTTVQDNANFMIFTGAVEGATNLTFTLTANRTSYTAAAWTPNQIAVARGLDSLAANTPQTDNGDAETLLAELDWMGPGANFRSALDYLSPEPYDVIHRVHRRTAQASVDTHRDHMNVLRTGTGQANAWPEQALAQADGGAAMGGDAGMNGCGMSVYAVPIGQAFEDDGGSDRTGYQACLIGVQGGVDWWWGSNLVTGVLVDYGNTDINYHGLGGDGEMDSIRVGGYLGTRVMPQWYVDGLVAYGYHMIEQTRPIVVGTIARNAKGDWEGHDITVQMESGYDLFDEAQTFVSITPFASVTYNYFYQEEHRERGAGAASLYIEDQHTHALPMLVGVRVAKRFQFFLPMVAEVAGGWRHDFLADDQDDIQARFVNAAGRFEVHRGAAETDSANVTARLGVQVTEAIEVNGFYSGDWSADADAHRFGASVSFRW